MLWTEHSAAKGFAEKCVPVCKSILRSNGIEEVLPYVDKVLEVTNPGMEKSELVYQAAIVKVDDYYFRRKGLGVASLIITILAIALYFKIRRIVTIASTQRNLRIFTETLLNY